jgi:hypothetical protein
MGANEAGYLRKTNNINNSNIVGTKLENKENRESRQDFGKTELDPVRKYNAGQKNKRSYH